MNSMVLRLMKYISNSNYRFKVNAVRGMYNSMPDEEYLKHMFKATMGYELNLDNPQTFNEKLQWLKLYDRKSIYTTMVDKYEVKNYVAKIIGEEYIIPTIGIWDSFEEIDFEKLPNEFVLKSTHDSGGLVICRDKNEMDLDHTRKKIVKSLKRNYFYYGREWPYKHVKPRIIVEKYMEDSTDQMSKSTILKDYKVYTFNGKAKICMINQDRGIYTKADYFDRNYKWLNFTWGYDHSSNKPPRPKNYELMFELAERLAIGTIELRVDFYEVNGILYFGELTFFDGSGFDRMEPVEWDYTLGSWIKLPKKI